MSAEDSGGADGRQGAPAGIPCPPTSGGAPEISVVVPALNEADSLPLLLAGLAAQEGVRVEVVVADGGSTDGTLGAAAPFANRGFEVRSLPAGRGRGRQMNAGAREARAPELLFLHADTRIDDRHLLRRAWERMGAERRRRGTHRVAGRFGVRFLCSRPGAEGAYYFYEAKARLDRQGVANGDQGLWVSQDYFAELGGFDESLPYLEDARLAAGVSATGAWALLPGRLSTSARRFEAEGLRERQTLNALISNFDAIGLRAFFDEAAGAYREQDRAGRLRLGPFARIAHRASRAEGWRRFLGYWWATGGYVAANAWQLAFALDCRRNRRAGLEAGEGPTPWLARYDRWAASAVTSRPGQAAATLVTAAWFFAILSRGPRGGRQARKPG